MYKSPTENSMPPATTHLRPELWLRDEHRELWDERGFMSRYRANREQLQGLVPESPGQNLALTVLYVPYSLDSGTSVVPRNVQRFRGGLVFKADRPLYHSTRGLRVIKREVPRVVGGERVHVLAARGWMHLQHPLLPRPMLSGVNTTRGERETTGYGPFDRQPDIIPADNHVPFKFRVSGLGFHASGLNLDWLPELRRRVSRFSRWRGGSKRQFEHNANHQSTKESQSCKSCFTKSWRVCKVN